MSREVFRTISSQSSLRWFSPMSVMLLVGVCLVVFPSSPVPVSGEVYSSTADLQSVLQLERHIVQMLDTYVHHTQTKLEKIRSYIREYHSDIAGSGRESVPSPKAGASLFGAAFSQLTGAFAGAEHAFFTGQPELQVLSKDEELAEKIVGNPVQAYLLMKRLTVDWSGIEQTMAQNDWHMILNEVASQRHKIGMPVEEDLQGAAMALIRLQDTYKLNITDLSHGTVLGITAPGALTARDCLYLGRHSMHSGFLDRAIEWMEQALQLAHVEKNTTAPVDEINHFLNQAISLHDDALSRGEQYHTFDLPVSTMAPSIQRMINEQLQKKYVLGPELSPEDDSKNYQALCRGEKLLSSKVQSQLQCHLVVGDDFSFVFGPIKIEQAHVEPDIYHIHDVINDDEIEYIKKAARPLLQRSTVVGVDGRSREVSTTRTSKNAWLYDEQDYYGDGGSRYRRILERLEKVTGLNIVGDHNSEALQVANYGIGGHYNPHHDYLFQDKTPEQFAEIDPKDTNNGDRIATLMFYLSDVERGGATVFPRIGVSIWPKKGSAAFWYNLHKDNSADVLTLHGACPVVHGSKWVANKWIRERNQVFARPCGKQQYE